MFAVEVEERKDYLDKDTILQAGLLDDAYQMILHDDMIKDQLDLHNNDGMLVTTQN